MNEFYNNHYIRTDASGSIVEGWSDGPHNGHAVTEDDILINEQGGYQFRLIVDGEQTEENPPLYTFDGIPLHRWNGSAVMRRTDAEIEADRAARPEPGPTEVERLEAQVTYTAMMTDTLLEV